MPLPPAASSRSPSPPIAPRCRRPPASRARRQATIRISGRDRAEPRARPRARRSRSRSRRRTGSRRRGRRREQRDSATTRRSTGPTIAPKSVIGRSAGALHQDQRAPARGSPRSPRTGARPRPPAPGPASGARAARRARGAGAGDAAPAAELVAVALELRRPLADPGAAVGALGHVGADLRAAAAADDAELRRAHAPRIPRPPQPTG